MNISSYHDRVRDCALRVLFSYFLVFFVMTINHAKAQRGFKLFFECNADKNISHELKIFFEASFFSPDVLISFLAVSYSHRNFPHERHVGHVGHVNMPYLVASLNLLDKKMLYFQIAMYHAMCFFSFMVDPSASACESPSRATNSLFPLAILWMIFVASRFAGINHTAELAIEGICFLGL